QVCFEEHSRPGRLATALIEYVMKRLMARKHATPLASAVEPPVKRIQRIKRACINDLGASLFEIDFCLIDQLENKLAVFELRVDHKHGDCSQVVIQLERSPWIDRQIGPEACMDKADDTAFTLGDDQARGVEVDP